MVEEEGVVLAVEKSSVLVETQRRSVCGQCAANKGCGTSILQQVLGKKRTVLRVIKTFPVNEGERVVVGLDENALVKGSIAVYALPIAAMIACGIAAETVADQLALAYKDGISIISALMGLMLSFLGLKKFSRTIADDTQYQPVLLRQANSINIEPNSKFLT